MPQLVYPVILSGGAGTRLWPLSRALRPKQLLPLASEKSMLQETVRRVTGTGFGAPMIVCNAQHRFMIAEQMREIGDQRRRHRPRAGGPQHRPGGDRCRRAPRRSGSGSGDAGAAVAITS